MLAGRRAKSRTHGTSPFYERNRRNSAAKMARAEKQEGRRGRERAAPVDILILHQAARRAMDSTGSFFIWFKEIE